ncbi:MAG: tRNA 2-thiocytidine biosynthesis protein TtcA [Clostridia bacterium]|nr:tRNA 2-thiocytidine biosynthesis protein TtcA [Clostridia bacterium]
MREILSKVRSACDRYNMIDQGDKIAVGVSGGKDSLLLLAALAEMRRFYPKNYSVTAVALDPCFDGTQNDYGAIESLCKKLDVELIIRRSTLWQVVFEDRKESNPCSLCAKMRRGILHDMALEAGCNKIALGHNLDDAAETFFLNLLRGGHIGCFSPVTYLSRKDLYMIRPLVLTKESTVAAAAKRLDLPIIKSRCPLDKYSARQETKELIRQLEKDYPSLREKIIGAMQRGGISGWGSEKEE